MFLEGEEGEGVPSLSEDRPETMADVFARAGRVYLFVMALTLLGEGFKPIIDAYIIRLPTAALYWINMISAILDNATLTAAEISPRMTLPQIRSVLMGLLIAGGMLIPGNIPNIIAAGKLEIGSREWARLGVPLGLVMMAIAFVFLMFVFPEGVVR
jgi:predicted cation transporter